MRAETLIAIRRRRGGIDAEAASWAWLMAVNKSGGQEWQFSANAREKGSAWSAATIEVWNAGKALVAEEDIDYKACLESLRKSCGQIEDLP